MRDSVESGRAVWVPLTVAAAYTLMILAWVFGNPPHGAPDELAHYVRAASIGHGVLVGERGPPEAIVGEKPPPGLSEATYRAQLEWTRSTSRRVVLPAGLSPSWFCQQTNPLVSAKCVDETPVSDDPTPWVISTGGYEPLPYLLPALASRLPASPNDLDRLMRLAKAVSCLLLLIPALVLLWRGSNSLLSLLGPLMAITPMVVFLIASLNPSGLEIASSIAFFAAVLRLARGDHPAWTWAVLGPAGAALALSRGPAPTWVASGVVLLVLLLGPRQSWRAVQRDRRWSYPALGAVVVGVLLNRLWEGLYGSRLTFDPTPLRSSLGAGWSQLPGVLDGQIGIFDYLEFAMPWFAYRLWISALVALVVIALVVGRRRDRLLLSGAVLAALALPVLLQAAVLRHSGFGFQGRYALPFSVVVPLLAGEVLLRERASLRRLDAEGLFAPFAVVAAVVQVVGWWSNARRFAVGTAGPRWFVGSAEWSPPLGWWPWLLTMLTGALVLATIAPVSRLLARGLTGPAAAARVRGEP